MIYHYINTQRSADDLDYGFRNTEKKNKIVILLHYRALC